MFFFQNLEEVTRYIEHLKLSGQIIGFVPTMGALHEGHLSLVKKAKQVCDITVASIYVNPLQFNSTNDFNLYPRLLERDKNLLENEGVDIIFCPDDSIIKESKKFDYNIGFLDTVMEGFYRPDHFKGVAFIVKKLFEIVKPHKAFFGLKDYQQLAVVRKMAKDFNFNIDIIPCQTLRETNGLAMSSRNERLSPKAREEAGAIFNALLLIKENCKNKSVAETINLFKKHLALFPNMRIEYIEICDALSLKSISDWKECSSCVACTSVFLENVRLIDNIIIF